MSRDTNYAKGIFDTRKETAQRRNIGYYREKDFRSTSALEHLRNRINILVEEEKEFTGITQKEIANDLMLSEVYFSRYLNGKYSFPPEIVVMLAKRYNVTLDYLYGQSNSRNSDSDEKYACDSLGIDSETYDAIKRINIDEGRSRAFREFFSNESAFSKVLDSAFCLGEKAKEIERLSVKKNVLDEVCQEVGYNLNEFNGYPDSILLEKFLSEDAVKKESIEGFGAIQYKLSQQITELTRAVAEQAVSSPLFKEEIEKWKEELRTEYGPELANRLKMQKQRMELQNNSLQE